MAVESSVTGVGRSFDEPMADGQLHTARGRANVKVASSTKSKKINRDTDSTTVLRNHDRTPTDSC